MYFTTFEYMGSEKIGVLNNEKTAVIPIENIITENTPITILELVQKFSDEYFSKIHGVLTSAKDSISLSDVKLLSPIPNPLRNVVCVGRNYKSHIDEVSRSMQKESILPEHPVYFSKMVDRIYGPDEYVPSHDDICHSLDYEAELAVIIGKEGKDIPYDKVEEYIFGYTVVNDLSARSVQNRHEQWFRGKSLDGLCTMGPYIVHKSLFSFPPILKLTCTVNGEIRQNSDTSHLIFDIATLISEFSKGITLRAGDIVATGTPSGVGVGFKPPRFLKHGDVVECTVEKIGTLKNIID